jgi:DNA-binding CsgD family transcriptional regulator
VDEVHTDSLTEAAQLWDELADEPGTGKATRIHLMERLAARLNAQNVAWIAAVRTAIDRNDPLRGWRIAALNYLHAEAIHEEVVREMKRRWARREVDPFNVSGVLGAGTFRATTLRRSMPEAWFEDEYYRIFYAGRGIFDALWVSAPVTDDAESFFIFHRSRSAGAFGDADVTLASLVLRGIKWLHRRWMLEHGLLVASKPLSPTERHVLVELLSDAKEAEVARRLSLTPATVHEYVKTLFRKFGVSSRPGLMSLWLNHPTPATDADPDRNGATLDTDCSRSG